MLFSQVVGQNEIKKKFVHEINEGKISHAQLFAGKAGYGGLPLALAFSQYLFCENRKADDSCGHCPSCLKVQDLQHPDLHFAFPTVLADNKMCDPLMGQWREQVKEQPYFNQFDWIKRIDPKERNPVLGTEHSQEILRKLSLKSYEGGYKVMIIWMAEAMNATCSNKILKILEEPPANTLFLLVTESAEELLITIRSRTQIVRLSKIDVDDLAKELVIRQGFMPKEAETMAYFVEGDFLEALHLSNNAEEKSNLTELFMQMMRVSYKKDVLGMMKWAESIAAESKENQKSYLVYALHMMRQSIIGNYLGLEMIRASEDELKFLKNFAPFITGNNIREFMKTFNDAHYHVERNANSSILFTQLCFQTMRYIHVA